MKNQSTSVTAISAPKLNRSDVLCLTWKLVRDAKLAFADALKKAWATLRIKAEMLVKPVSFSYRKDDGTIRNAVGNYVVTSETPGKGKPANPLIVRYFDTLADGWRSFRIDRLIC